MFRAIKFVFAISLIASLLLIFGDTFPFFRRTQPTDGRLELFTFSILWLSATALMLRTMWRHAAGGSILHKGMLLFASLVGAVSLFVIGGFILVAG